MSYSQETTNNEFVTAVVVEYGTLTTDLEEDELTYCKSHIWKLNENFKMFCIFSAQLKLEIFSSFVTFIKNQAFL